MHAPAPVLAINPLIFGPQKTDSDVSKFVFFFTENGVVSKSVVGLLFL